jgi:PAS domain S-box-containing protein
MNNIGAPGLVSCILNTIHDAVVWIDTGSRIVEWNSAAERVFGFMHDDVVGRSLTSTIIPDEHRVAHLNGMAKFMSTGTGQLFGHTVEINAMTWSGTELPIAITIGSIVVEGNQYFTAHIRSLNEMRAASLKTEPIENFPPPAFPKAG